MTYLVCEVELKKIYIYLSFLGDWGRYIKLRNTYLGCQFSPYSLGLGTTDSRSEYIITSEGALDGGSPCRVSDFRNGFVYCPCP